MEPYFSIPIPLSEKIEFQRIHGKTLVLLKKIKESGNYNKDYPKDFDKIKEIFNYVNYTLMSQELIHVLLDSEKSKKMRTDLAKECAISEAFLRNLYDVISIHSILQFYKTMESSLQTFLLGQKYTFRGKKSTVSGIETIPHLKMIIDKFTNNAPYIWEEIDFEFRNALAHGKYLVKDCKFVYYPKSDFSNPIILSKKEFMHKSRKLNMIAMSIVSAVGDFEGREQFDVSKETECFYLKD